MINFYEMLKDSIIEYESINFPYALNDITSWEKAIETEKVIKRLDLLKDKIFVYAMMYVDEREGIKDDI